MESFMQYLVPYLVSQVVAIVFIMIAYKSTRITRLLFAIIFIGAAATNLSTGLTQPEVYQDYAKMALPFYKHFINGWFSQYSYIMVPLIAIGQLLIGIGMLLKGGWVNWACFGAVIFLVGITPLMFGSAFPFTLLVSWAALVVFKKDNKQLFWKNDDKDAHRIHDAKLSLGPATLLSWVAFMLTLVATATGLFAPDVYRDNEFVSIAWHANDWVTLLIVVPAFLLVLLIKNALKAQLVWAGVLGYLIYNYAYYLFGAAYNVNFLVYVGIIASSIWSLVALLQNMPVSNLKLKGKHYRWIAVYLFFIAAMLLAIELPPVMAFSFTGNLPDIVIKSNHPTSVVYALDLVLIFPACIVAGYWLWKRKPWGIVLSAIMLVKAAAYGLVLCCGSILLMLNKVDTDPLLPFYVFLALGGVVGLTVLLRSVKKLIFFSDNINPKKKVQEGLILKDDFIPYN